MVTKLPLAWKEKERQSVLLVGRSDEKTEPVSTSGNERKKSSSATRGYKVTEAKDTPRQSKGSRKTKGANASSPRPKGHKRNHKNRKSDRGNEGENTTLRRSASELGIVFPDSSCSDTAHYWIEIDYICSGVLFRCKYCHIHEWLPMHFTEALQLGDLMRHFGDNEGYCQYLSHASRRPAKILMAKLQKLETLSTSITDAHEMAKIAVKILDQKEYDRR